MWVNDTSGTDRYDHRTHAGHEQQREQMARTPEQLEQALHDGEWLRPGDAAIVLGCSRKTVDRMLKPDPPLMRWRHRPGVGQYREVHPKDVLRELARIRRVHGEGESGS